MDVALAKRIEKIIERASSALLGAAVGYAVYAYFSVTVPQPQLGALSGGAATMFYVLCVRALKAVGPATPRYPVAIFDLREIDSPIDELLLTDANPLSETAPAAGEPLVLDDILAEIGPGARVVRLFDPAAMPRPGRLQAHIDRHLDPGGLPGVSPDATQALHEALAELRRSLR